MRSYSPASDSRLDGDYESKGDLPPFPSMFVISRNCAFFYEGKAVKTKRVSQR